MTGQLTRREFLMSGLAGAGAPALLSCRSPTDLSLGNPRLTVRPTAPTSTPSIGLSPLGLGNARDGVVYVPASYSQDTAAPLFVVLHGAGGKGTNWVSYYDRAEQRGMVLLAPDSRDRTWDVVRGAFGADVAFLDFAMARVFQQVRIDPTRIALGGFSDGASYALSLGVSNGDLFSHLTAYSPGFFFPAEPIVGMPPVFVSHGTNDQILPVRLSRDDIVPRLQGRGHDVTYNEFDGGHEVPAPTTETALDWFLG